MVMKRNAMRKNLRQSIIKSFGRYIAIATIIALGAAVFVGLLMTKADMIATGQQFVDRQNMFDLRAVSNYGWTKEYVQEFAELEGVEAAEGISYVDLIAATGDAEEDSVYRFYPMPETVNKVDLQGGRMPERADECLADGFRNDDSDLGKIVTISMDNDPDSLDMVRSKTFTIVGYVATPLYMDMNRGTTSVGSGSVANYYYVPQEALDIEYYTEIDLKLEGSHAIYTDEYNDFLDASADRIKSDAQGLSERRFQEVKAEAEKEYDKGYQEYLDGVQEYEDGKAEAEQKLADAEQELKDAEEELEANRKKLVDAGNQIAEGREQIKEAKIQLETSKKLLSQQLQQISESIPLAEEDIARAEELIGMTGEALAGALASAQQNVAAAQQKVNSAQQKVNSAQQELDALQADPEADPLAVEAARLALAAAQGELSEAQMELSAAQNVLDGLNRLNEIYSPVAAALSSLLGFKQQLESALQQVEDNLAQLQQKEHELNSAYNTLMVNWGKWGQGRDEIAQGWEDYEQAKLDAAEELAEAEAKLEDAKLELEDARDEIDAMDKAEIIVLDRNSNVGYSNLNSNSDIVAGVSRVFPVFFLLIASLVCITTMTRMIDEERTQIGTLKALGYSNREIMGKYLFYSGSGAVLGCGLGILAGCTVFPRIIWSAYCIMLNIQPDVVLTVNWPLALTVVLVYTAVMLLVTWNCCRRTLEEEPAELIRPKAPASGKQILLEYMPFWKKISFLNKVTIRNIFRYRQRLAMMLVGIGGCTALLLTGFGLRDSISNVASYQFEHVTRYDISVYFRDALTEKQSNKFQKTVQDKADNFMFYHQSSVEVEYDNQTKEIYLISGDSDLRNFLDLHKGDNPISLPGRNEAVISAGVAENLGIDRGDTILLRDADLQTMELTVSGIYDNHVYNYVIVSPETIEAQWGSQPELQMAFVTMKEGEDVHALSADISDLSFVMNVAVSDDLAEMVNGMMDALDMVVWVIVFCAGLLAVTVLYNLTNININERIREIATIKVLGFNAKETAAYVFKENLALTVVGAGLGLLFGKLLLLFVMSQIKIDMVWFKALTEPVSYLWSIALTLLSAVAVDFIFFFKLDKINMAEALKSVE